MHHITTNAFGVKTKIRAGFLALFLDRKEAFMPEITNTKLSASSLKIIAMVTMLIDHIGFVFNILLFRIIGRIAFPIFAFQISEGFLHTRNKSKYLFRLAVFALLSLIPIYLYNGEKGLASKNLKYLTYIFYPAHMLILCVIQLVSF